MVGGGGLIQLPALMIFLPPQLAANLPAVFGTNKFASICGTSVAASQYLRKVKLEWAAVFPAALAAFILSGIGARTVTLLDPAVLKPMILVLLVGVAIFTIKRKSFGQSTHLREASPKVRVWLGIVLGGVIGFYDGFFGPGTGSFLIFMFILIFGFDFLHASAGAKIVNFATNLSAVLYFGFTGNIFYEYAIPMAACNILGSTIGSRMAILKGNVFIRKLFLVVLAALVLRLAWELFFSR